MQADPMLQGEAGGAGQEGRVRARGAICPVTSLIIIYLFILLHTWRQGNKHNYLSSSCYFGG